MGHLTTQAREDWAASRSALLALGGERYDVVTVFVVFGAAFLVAALSAFALPEQRGRALQ